MRKRRITRRTFLVQMGTVVAGGVAASCARPAATPTQAPPAATAVQATAAPKPTTVPTAAPAATAVPTVAPTAKPAAKYKEAPMLADLVKQGKLPPVEQRLPEDPLIQKLMDKVGRYGGKLSSIISDPTADLPEIENAINAGLSIATRDLDLKTLLPSVAQNWELSKDYKELIVRMRKGLKWSDGKPLTTADVRFWYEDVFLNKDLTPQIDTKWAPDGQPMKVIIDDDYTFRIQFAVSYPVILDFLIGLGPWLPKHYLSQYHIKHNDKVADLAKSEKFDTWVQCFQFHIQANQLQQDNKLPELKPWLFDHRDQQGNRFYVRNPYYWKVDPEGNQLPYVDTMERIVVENKEVLNAKVLAGEGTHHSWFLTLANYALYKQNEQKGGYTIGIYPDTRASEMGFCFNYTHADEVLRTLFNDLRWRQAMSHAINRAEINELRFAGMGIPRQPIMDPGCSFYKEGIDQYYVKYDAAKAGQLLDEIGLKWDSAKQFRLRPDGKPLALIIEVDAGRADLAEICNLIKGYWAKVGVNVSVKGEDQKFFMQRMVANQHDIGVWAIGGSSEPYSRAGEPIRYVPPWHWTNTPLGGPLWRQWLDTSGKEGLEPPEIIKKLWDTASKWRKEPYGTETYKKLGAEMLLINAENCWCIGTVGLVPRPAILKNTVRNAPKPGKVLSMEYDMWNFYVLAQWWIEG